jgi:hypothetical protein
MEQYSGVKDYFFSVMDTQKFNPENTAPAILKLMDTDEPPMRVFFGNVWPMVKGIYEERMKLWEDWNEFSVSAS